MAAVLLAATLVRELIYIPAQKRVLHLESPHRLLLVPKMIGLEFKVATVTALTVLLATVFLSFEAAADNVLLPFTITAYLAAVSLPAQEHSRRMLHLAGFHASAVIVAASQLVLAVIVLTLALLFDALTTWVPFLAIAIIRLSSLIVAFVIVGTKVRRLEHVPTGAVSSTSAALTTRALMVDGRWLLGGTGLITATNLVTIGVVGGIAGFEAAGYAEAARILASPIQVLGMGLNSALSRQVLAAGRARDALTAKRIVRGTWGVLSGAAVAYGAFSFGLGSITAVVDRFPSAFEIPGLVAIWVASYALVSAALPRRSELIGADHEQSLLRSNLIAASAQLVVAVVLASLGTVWLAVGAAAGPLALASQGFSNTLGYGRTSKKMHNSHDSLPTDMPAVSWAESH